MGWYSDAVGACEDTAEPMGDFWGAAYGAGAFAVTGGNIGAAAATSTIIDHTVTQGTPAMCHLLDPVFDNTNDTSGGADTDGSDFDGGDSGDVGGSDF